MQDRLSLWSAQNTSVATVITRARQICIVLSS
jgi:hypothetical protein